MSQSTIARKLRLAAGHKVAVLNAPTGYKPVAIVAIDDKYTALRFNRG